MCVISWTCPDREVQFSRSVCRPTPPRRADGGRDDASPRRLQRGGVSARPSSLLCDANASPALGRFLAAVAASPRFVKKDDPNPLGRETRASPISWRTSHFSDPAKSTRLNLARIRTSPPSSAVAVRSTTRQKMACDRDDCSFICVPRTCETFETTCVRARFCGVRTRAAPAVRRCVNQSKRALSRRDGDVGAAAYRARVAARAY